MRFIDKIKLKVNKSKYIIVYTFDKDKTISVDLGVKEHNLIKLESKGRTIDYNSDHIFYINGNPSVVVNTDSPTSGSPLDWTNNTDFTSEDFYNALEQSVSRDIIREINDSDKEIKTLMLLVGASIVATFVGVYLINGWIEAIATNVDEIKATIELLEGTMRGGY